MWTPSMTNDDKFFEIERCMLKNPLNMVSEYTLFFRFV